MDFKIQTYAIKKDEDKNKFHLSSKFKSDINLIKNGETKSENNIINDKKDNLFVKDKEKEEVKIPKNQSNKNDVIDKCEDLRKEFNLKLEKMKNKISEIKEQK